MNDPSIAAALARRRAAAAAAWELTDQFVLIGAGDRISVPGRYDITYPFRAHSEYLYLTDRERPGGVLAFDPSDGWIEFVQPVTREELLWAGADGLMEGTPDGARSRAELDDWLDARRHRVCGRLGVPVPGVTSDAELDEELRHVLTQVRRPKDEVELARMRTAEQATRSGFLALEGLIGPGRTERELQIELEAEFLRNGADAVAYETIIAGGAHSAVLHFAPSQRPLGEGELVLIDAGGEYHGYASDVTRTYAVSGEFTPEQGHVYETVRRALEAAIQMCGPRVEWRDVHRAAAVVIGEGLVEVGILRGNAESLFERGAVSLFFPHGVGHMVGLGVRDAGGVSPGRSDLGPGFPRLRVDLPLEPGYAMTVEPGIYFIPAMYGDTSREELRDAVNWDRAEGMLGFGGIRLE
ncbi:MAG TPA: aminopeptidase P N-terminal domain-containing protein, partial [Candidatus Limnocylindria bacterium]|nr:aminopeptidase P N-terminal domain-containing protein [Candidatus Limnocylindria bacterium]